MTALADLTDEEFRDELDAHMFGAGFEPFLEHDIVDRTRDVLTDITVVVEQQLIAHGDKPESADWARKAKGFQRQVVRRLVSAKSVIRARNRAETASVAAIEKKWADFAYDLAVELEDSDAGHFLDEIMLNDITARQWLDAREAQQAAKAEKVAV